MLGFRTHRNKQIFKNGAPEDRLSEETNFHLGEQKALPERNVFSNKDVWGREESMIQAEEVEELYTENCKTLIREIEEVSSKWKGILCLDWENSY